MITHKFFLAALSNVATFAFVILVSFHATLQKNYIIYPTSRRTEDSAL